MSGDEQHEAASTPQKKPFRFKDGPDHETRQDEDESPRKKRRHHHRRHASSRHRSKRQKTASHLEDEVHRRPESMRDIDPDQAFRESLFDALGDDEGANFWEGVYGQPIHKYPNQYIDEETGELETMDEEEYAQYVRRRMWEKSREGIEAAREENIREKARQKAKDQETRAKAEKEGESAKGPYNNLMFDFDIEASLRRGQRRKDERRWRQLWTDYLQRWDTLQTLVNGADQDTASENLALRNKIAWPVESGKRKDVIPAEIERFVTSAAQAAEADEESKIRALVAAVKSERIRWHPDKVQQRFGFMNIDETTMKGVTATFQVLDRMWNDLRSSKQ